MKRRENSVAATYKPLTPAERAILRQRGNRRRASIQRGVVRVHFVKLLPASAPRVWPAVPEPKPFCSTCNREVELRHLALLNGAYFCRFCTGLVNWPLYTGPERPQEWTAGQSFDPSAASISAEVDTKELFDGVWNAITSSQCSSEAWRKIAELCPERPADWTPGEAEEDLRCSRCGAPNNYGECCDVCGDYMEQLQESAEEWARSLDMPSPPWPGGAA